MTAPDAAPLDRLLEHRAWVRGLVRRLVLDPQGADDVEQQVWLTAVRHGGASIDEPRAWLGTVARNWARRAWRGTARRTRREAAVARPEVAESDGDPVERAEEHRAVVDAVLALPEPLRTAVLLHHFDALSVADVSVRVGAPHETVRSRLRLARNRLRDALGPSHGAAAWSPALLALAGLPRGFMAPAASGAASVSTGALAMTTAQKVALTLVLPASIGAAWVAARVSAATPETPARDESLAALAARIERVEKTVAALPAAGVGNDRALARRMDALEERLGAQTNAAPAGPGTAEPAGPQAKGAAKPADTSADDAKLAKAKILDALKSSKPGSPEHLAALRQLGDWLIANAGPPAVDEEIAWAQNALDREARAERITAAEAGELASFLDRAAPGSAARPGIAVAVAGGWAKDASLPNFLGRFPANAEPKVHTALLALLDHHPSAAFSDYVLRLVRDERDAGVLSSALDVDRVQAATNAENAAAFAQAVDARMADGSLDAKARRRAACAIGVCGLRSREMCIELLSGISQRDADGGIKQASLAAAESLVDGSATAKSLEKLFK